MSVGISTSAAEATKLSAPPLPREREEKDFAQGQSLIVQTSRFQRRPDYREMEAEKTKEKEEANRQAEGAKAKAAEDAKKAQLEQIENLKKRQELALEVNYKAVLLGKQGRWLEAIETHEEAVKLDSQNKQLRINLSAARTTFGQAKLKGGDLDTAASLFRKALAAAPDNGLAGRLLGQAMGRQGRDPASADVRLATGDQLAAIGDLEGASVEYQAAMQLEGSARTYMKMGDMAMRFGQVTTATNWYRQAIVKDPDYGPAHRQLGLLSLSQRDYTGAAASLRKAVILDPKDIAAGQSLVEIWRRQVAANPLLAENHLGLAGALQLTGDFVGAESEYRKLEALDPKNPGLEAGRASMARAIQHIKAEKHKLAAATLFNQGLRREALSEVSQAVLLEPRNAGFQFLLGECLEANGDYQGAHQAYLTCVLIDPENNQEAAARMKQMQSGNQGRAPSQPQSANQLAGQIASQIAAQFGSQAQLPMSGQATYHDPAQQAVMAAPGELTTVTRKNMFEGGPATQQATNAPALSFRTHDESDAQAAQASQTIGAGLASAQVGAASAQPLTPATANAQAESDSNLNDQLSRVTDAEAQKDYGNAVNILRQLLANNLQNAEVHHRLAVNLLNSGQISEAISEFRIASALSPSKKSYADDLARALVIHKRSLMSDSGTGTSSENAGAIK